jgi:(S)-2-hydroxyglutarate dehydrogenase
VQGSGVHDVLVIGAGIVGLATAYQLQRLSPGLGIVVVDKERCIGVHQTGRNSGVVHAGLYYEPGSRKAHLCRAGKEELERFADDHAVPLERCGKLVVAVHPAELPGLDELHRRATANGVPGLRLLGPDGIREREPSVAGLQALLSPTTAITDFARVAEALAAEIRDREGTVQLGTRVHGIRRSPRGWAVETPGGALHARTVVACAGLHSDRVAALTGDAGTARILPFRGRYLRLRPGARGLVRNLVYPVPDPRLPFLGVHFTRRVDGEVLIGPNVALAFAREGYRRATVRPRDLLETVRFPGLWRFMRRYPAAVARETWRDVSRRAFVAEARRFVPDLRHRDVLPGPAGVRAQLVNRDGTLEHDFSFEGRDRLLHVRNAPSPGATSALAIGRVIADRLLAHTDV